MEKLEKRVKQLTLLAVVLVIICIVLGLGLGAMQNQYANLQEQVNKNAEIMNSNFQSMSNTMNANFQNIRSYLNQQANYNILKGVLSLIP